MSKNRTNDDLYVDANGHPTERASTPNGPDVILHYGEIPELDVTTIDGVRCTTPLRAVIDLAPELDRNEWKPMVRECLERGLFSRKEAMDRTSRPDMLTRPGAQLLRELLSGTGAVG